MDIYLLRGLTRESGHWGDFVQILQSKIPHTTIHLMDLPGSGKYVHEKASSQVGGLIEFMRTDFLKSSRKETSVRVICATSLAGMVATEWVIRHPNDFQGLIIISSSFGKICSAKERVLPQVRMDMFRILLARNIETREALIVKVNSNRPENYPKITEDWVKIQRERTMTRMNILRQTLAGLRYSVRDHKPRVPMLIVGSKADRMVCSSCIEKTHALFGGTLVWHPTSGHSIPLDEPEWLACEIEFWI